VLGHIVCFRANTVSSSSGEKVPVSRRRPRFEFPEEIHLPKAIKQSQTVTMTLPERLAPKGGAHTIAQEYTWAAQSMGDLQYTHHGHINEHLAWLVEVMSGPTLDMIREATHDDDGKLES
jgi:hypothetical protein